MTERPRRRPHCRHPVAATACVLVTVLLLVSISGANAFWTSTKPAAEKKEAEQTKKVLDYNVVTIPKEVVIDSPIPYGVDVSFPIHHKEVSTNYLWLPHNMDPKIPTPSKYKDMPLQPMGNRQAFYDDFLQGCIDFFGSKGARRCIDTENDRIEMSLRQPQSMQNYTDIGFKKIRAPASLFALIKEFWDKNHQFAKKEQWGTGNTYTNNWLSSSNMVSVEDSSLRGGGYGLKQKIWDEARSVISAWTGEELTQCSLYGIRVYHENAVLSTHVDRLPLVSSAIINVAQDLDEPWPLEVIGHDGVAYNVTMEPGDMVLYESHSVLHGRPYPLKGRYMANLFVHFEPTGHSLRHNAKIEHGDVDKKYKEAAAKGVGGHENEHAGLPPYILAGSPEESHWREQNPAGFERKPQEKFTTGSTPAHVAAQAGAVEILQEEIKKSKEVVNAKDKNGWTPLHEGARGGHLEVVKLLVESGADINAKTYGTSGTPLWWAKQTLAENHPVIDFLESIGALAAGPEL